MGNTSKHLELMTEARTRFANLLKGIKETDLPKKLGGSPNSAGFLIRHIADVECLFAKNVFGDSALKVSAKTVITGHDSGEWTKLQELLDYQAEAFQHLLTIVGKQSDADWDTVVETKEFGRKTKSEALGRIVSHTAYHAGQLALTLKYGV